MPLLLSFDMPSGRVQNPIGRPRVGVVSGDGRWLLHGDLGIRDRAIIETLYSTGNRRAELAGFKLRDTARNLNTFPDAGRIVPELGDETIRERFVYSYRLIYRIQGQRGADRCRRARLVR